MPSLSIYTIFLCLLSNGIAEFKDDLTVYEKECLGEDKFHCGQSQCIWVTQHCDGTVDCDNGADEEFCVLHLQNGTCKPDQFTCADGKQCIPAIWECNNVTNCDDRSDEVNCTALQVNHNSTCSGFTCGDGTCVSLLWACDGVYDCADKSDEMPAACKHDHLSLSYDPSHCSTPIHTRGNVPKECVDKSYCLPEGMYCDGMKDCKDGSDEGTFCLHWHKMCVNHSCGNDTKAFCAPDPSGPKCYCENAATYNTSTKLCETIDLCQEARPYCGHKCEFVNGPLQFQCGCEDGYTMDKIGIGHACFAPDPEALLFFSTSNTVGYIKLRSKQKVTLLHTKQARGVASDGEYVFWVESSEGHEAIAKASVHDIERKTVLVGLGLEDPSEVAVDWQGGHIYFSDAERGAITVCRTDGKMCTTLHTDARVPKFVTLDPNNGKMYWADWHSGPVIQTADMAGRHASPLPVKLNASPTGLALDVPAQRLYYVDGTVRGVNLNNMKVFTLFDEQIYHPYALSVFENTLYWSDWASSTVQACDKATGQPTDQMYKFDSSVMGMHIYHPILMQSRYNPCAEANCSHFCFVTSNRTYMCGCPDGYMLEDKQCIHKIKDYRPTYLIAGGGARFTRIQYNAFGGPESDATTFDIGRVQAMTYDSHRDTLYMYDGERKTINSVSMSYFTTGHATMVLYKGLDKVVDMDYDYVTDSLYILDAGHSHKRIEVVSLRTMKQALVYRFIDETPISFCLLPDYGKMLVAVSETNKDEIHIDSLGLDGSGRQHVVMNDLKGPHISLRYSHNLNIVYIADEGNHIIETMHPEGTARETYKELSRTVTSLAVTDNLVQWSGRSSSRFYWADAHEASPRIRRVELASFPNTTHLHLQSTFPAPVIFPHPCDKNVCSDICVQTPRGQNGSLGGQNGSMGYKCLCPAGLLDLDGICTEAVSCKEYEMYCHLSNMCVSERRLCDGKHDCFHGEDELDCPAPPPLKNMTTCGVFEIECNGHCIHKENICNPIAFSIPITCTSAEFQCVTDDLCIERAQMCNGVADCPDGSDESRHLCTTLTCLHTEFLCSSGACILNSLRCDGEEDCSDGSDELNCARKTCPPDYFQCRNSECVELKKRCDHHSDCTDYSDEENCIDDDIIDNQEPAETCAAWEHTCELNSTICIPLTARCNGKVDCPGSTDESNCNDHCAPKGLFECKHEGICLTKDKLCNGKKDCVDGSDETPLVCGRVNRTSRVYNIHYFPAYECRSGYTCDSGQCIEWRDVCDHQPNCFDGSDESPLCFTACENHTCSHTCQPTPKGPTCQCPSGFEFATDRKTCRDVDECVNEPCSQRCINVAGSFLCACYRGYALRSDRRSCKATKDHLAVLYVTDNSVRSLTADGLPAVEFNDPNVSSVTDIDCDVRRRKLYVTSADASKLIELNSTKDQITVTNIGRPTRVAVDWISGNVYFVDSTPSNSYIRVCNVEKKRCAKLQRLPAHSITSSLVIDPASRLMFYCITHEQESIIWSATLGGGKVRDIATVHNCTGLAVDSFKRRLYVAQTGPASVTRMDFNGGGRTKILQNDVHLDAPHGLAIFEDHIYYLVANSFKLNRCLLYGDRNCEVYLQRIFNANTFVIRHESTQRDDLLHICDAYKCDNICVMDADGPVCLCDNGAAAKDGGCPLLGKDQLPLFNGWTTQDFASASKVSRTLLISVLVILALYLIVYVYYRCVYKKRSQRNDNYVPVHFTNSLTEFDGFTPFTPPLTPQVAIGSNRGEFLNPFTFMREVWRSSQRTRMPAKPLGTAGLKIDIPEFVRAAKTDVSDTESDIDEKENRIIIRRK